MAICLDSMILFFMKWDRKRGRGKWKWTENIWETDRQPVKRTDFVIIRSACTPKELSHCYVKPNETFMSAPSSHSQPIGMVHKWPIWLGWPLAETHLWQTGTLGKVQRGRQLSNPRSGPEMCGRAGRGTTFIGMNGKDHMLPEQLRVYLNLQQQKKRERDTGVGVEGVLDGKRCCGGSSRVGGGRD